MIPFHQTKVYNFYTKMILKGNQNRAEEISLINQTVFAIFTNTTTTFMFGKRLNLPSVYSNSSELTANYSYDQLALDTI